MKIELEVGEAFTSDPDYYKYKEALQLMLNRMSTSHFKYGLMRDKYPHSAKPVDCARDRQVEYFRTGNTEWCLDAANFLIIEHILPSHERAHFRATSSIESIGITYRED